jgi:hypothetical protein
MHRFAGAGAIFKTIAHRILRSDKPNKNTSQEELRDEV